MGVIVTLAGEVYHPSGLILVGREAAPNTLQQARERRDLAAETETLRARTEQLHAEREVAARAVEEARATLTQLQADFKRAQDTERKTTVSRDSVALEAERVSHGVQFQLEQIATVQAELSQVTNEVRALKDDLNHLYSDRRDALKNLETAREALAHFSLEATAEQLGHLQTAAAVAEQAAQNALARVEELERARATVEGLTVERQNKAQQLETESRAVADSVAAQRERANEVRGQLSTLNQHVLPQEKQLAELEAEQTRVESGDTHARAALHTAERQHAQAQLELTRKGEELENLRRRIEEDFGLVELDYGESVSGPTPLPLYPVVEKLARVDELPEGLEEQLNRQRGQLRRMGLINPEAQKEHQEVKERYEFLTTQTTDLQTAQTQLREVVAEMDVLMERDFRKTFDAVANEFRDTFARLFGGGTAKLMLTDPDHLSTTGIDIQARLPGRRPQSLAMLSGGERSLTACALIFALLRVSPTPFVVLDEVDAMLDEANVGRYRDMLQELSSQTQFIVITHNRNTVQAADTVYGITMGADSASQVIGLKLDEPVKAQG